MKNTFPNFETSATFKAWRGNVSQWLPVALDIAHSHGLSPERPHVFSTGTNLVVGLDDRYILKIFPPVLRAQFVSERGSLKQLRGRLNVPIPEIVFEGERDQWPYLVMTRLPGVVGAQAWPGLPEQQKERVLAHLGETIAALQRVPAGDLLGIELSWEAFMRGQIQGCRIRHERLGLPQKFLNGLDNLLRDAIELIPMNAPPVILTGEFIPENFLLRCQDGDWRISALIDFGDVLTGWGEYDLLGPSAFMTAGSPGRVRRFFEGFGYSKADVDFTCKRRLMALLLLHRASDPVNHICIEGWQQKADDLFQLQELIWPD